MANYKVVDADRLDADLKSVADSIRSRAGTEDALVFPDGFVGAVEGIPDTLYLSITQTLKSYESDKIVGPLRGTAFSNSQGLISVSLPNVTGIESYAFQNCVRLTEVYLPKITYLSGAAFTNCSQLATLDANLVGKIDNVVFKGCRKLTALILRKEDGVCTLGNTDSFDSTPIKSGTGYIYVPRALVDSYKSATNWSTYASQIRAIEDYPEITGG